MYKRNNDCERHTVWIYNGVAVDLHLFLFKKMEYLSLIWFKEVNLDLHSSFSLKEGRIEFNLI